MTNKEVLALTANAIGVAVQAKVDEYRDAANNNEDWHKKTSYLDQAIGCVETGKIAMDAVLFVMDCIDEMEASDSE